MKTLNPCKKDIACLSIFWYIDYGRVEGYKPFISINPSWRREMIGEALVKIICEYQYYTRTYYTQYLTSFLKQEKRSTIRI